MRRSSSNYRDKSRPRRPVLHLPIVRDAPPLDFAEARTELIRKTAYSRAAKRGVSCVPDSEDWLAAEAEIDARLNELALGSRFKSSLRGVS
jgi:hypothetical protein